jgi:hypothetical protein
MPGLILAIDSARAMSSMSRMTRMSSKGMSSMSTMTRLNCMTNMEGLLQIWKGYREVGR